MASVKQRHHEVASSYEQDFYAWANSNARLLRAGRLSEVDAQNIAEELETMGRSERREKQAIRVARPFPKMAMPAGKALGELEKYDREPARGRFGTSRRKSEPTSRS